MMKWMLYATLVAWIAGAAAIAWEQAAVRRRSTSRWAWAAALSLTVSIPLIHTITPVTNSERVLILAEGSSTKNSDLPSFSDRTIRRFIAQDNTAARFNAWLRPAWIFLSTATSIVFALGIYALRREQRRGTIAIVGGHQVVVTDSVGPAVMGLTKPIILLPRWIFEMSTRQRELIVAHELQHVRAKDEWLIGAAICVLIIFPWNVALWWQLKRLRLAIELDCDQRVLRNDSNCNEYGQVLIGAASRCTHDDAAVPALIESHSALERRIRTIVRSQTPYDKPFIAVLTLSSLAMCASAVALSPPAARPWASHLAASSIEFPPRVLSPQRELQEQWQSLVKVIEYFEPAALNTDRSKTPFIFIAADDEGRIVSHSLEVRPTWQAVPKAELQERFAEAVGDTDTSNSMFLQLSLSSARLGPNPSVVLLGIKPNRKSLEETAPRLDMSAIRRDRTWLEAFLAKKADNERAIIELADPAAIDVGLSKGTELWIALTAEGEFVQGGRRKIITDPNESVRFVERSVPASHFGPIAHGTAVKDARGNRVPVTWHWMQ